MKTEGRLQNKPETAYPRTAVHDAGGAPIPTTDDRFLGELVKVLQPKNGYRAGIDAVLLAAAAPIKDDCLTNGGKTRVLDAGSGVGVVGLCVAQRIASASVTMLERAPQLAELARENALRNDWEKRIRIIEGDLTGPAASLVSAGLRLESFDHVLANPPYYVEGAGTLATDPLKAGANAMEPAGLEQWARFLAAAARPGGTLSLIHRADALDKLLAALGHRFGAISILPIYPKAGEPANRIILHGIKGSRAPLKVLPGFTLHNINPHNHSTAFTPQAEAILRHGLSLQAAIAAPNDITAPDGVASPSNIDEPPVRT